MPLSYTCDTAAVVHVPQFMITVLHLATLSGGAGASPPVPTAQQLAFMDVGLSQFMHVGLEPYTHPHIAHDCVRNKRPQDCEPASSFNPSNLSTDQWVETAVAFGAKEICLTAHHEGGFALWPTQHNLGYTVESSPYKKDVLAQFVQSCRKHNVSICYYIGPNANGWLLRHGVNAHNFLERQLAMYRELIRDYGPITRFWWDHYKGRCNQQYSMCPGGFPQYWDRFETLIRRESPDTIICPGPDCSGHDGESGMGKYPVWYAADPDQAKPGHFTHQLTGSLFRPFEACVTPVPMWFPDGEGTSQLLESMDDLEDVWKVYANSVGIGYVNTFNAPPGTTGQIPEDLRSLMARFGQLIKPLATPAAAIFGQQASCADLNVVLETQDIEFNTVILREDLTRGQRIVKYAVEYFASGSWKSFRRCVGTDYEGCIHGQSVAAMLIDRLSYQSGISHIRFRCLEALEDPVAVREFGVAKLGAPAGAQPTASILTAANHRGRLRGRFWNKRHRFVLKA